ncbi:unnamed protein product [marine sediment metagenome]|uniref:Uncharacterized protein n=1 Tax=marine sediment metagenome TaxID=412755 RepID=X1J171_9ZZZZ
MVSVQTWSGVGAGGVTTGVKNKRLRQPLIFPHEGDCQLDRLPLRPFGLAVWGWSGWDW